jgi:hypothetical protein
MKVKFANANVDVRELRKGAVVLEYNRKDTIPDVFHVKSVRCVTEDSKTVKLVVSDAWGDYVKLTSELTWPI